MWNTRIYILMVSALVLLAVPIATMADTDSEHTREYQIKAAFLYNFTKFVDWPEEKTADSNEPVIIGIIGKNQFGNSLELLKTQKAKGRAFVIKQFKNFEELKKFGRKNKAKQLQQIASLRKCDLLFICFSEKKNFTEIITLVKSHNVLTVGETDGFLECDGIVNLLTKEEKVHFEINLTAARQTKLKISSKLLRLAKRVISEEKKNGANPDT